MNNPTTTLNLTSEQLEIAMRAVADDYESFKQKCKKADDEFARLYYCEKADECLQVVEMFSDARRLLIAKTLQGSRQ